MRTQLVVAAMLVLIGPQAHAAASGTHRTFVSGKGADTGSCGLPSPCRTFAYAITQTAAGGEIIPLDTAGYGPVAINKAISILNDSTSAFIIVSTGDGISIAAGPNDIVTIRGLTIDGGGTGSNGIVFNSGASLTIENCRTVNFAGAADGSGTGMYLNPLMDSSRIAIINSVSSDNGYVGIYLLTPFSTQIVIDRVTSSNNAYGLAILGQGSGNVLSRISNSQVYYNSTAGVELKGTALGSSVIMTASSNNRIGALLQNPAYSYFSRNTFIGNSYIDLEIDGSGGAVTFGDNDIPNRYYPNGGQPVARSPL